jgi:hypothetical protein
LEKNTNREGGWRVPAFVRWPKKFKVGTVLNGIVSHQDWLPTLLAAAGEADIAEKLREGHAIGDKTDKVHIDGLDMLPYLSGEAKESPRNFFFYISDDGDILAIRMKDGKVVLMEQRAHQLMRWFEPFVKLRALKMFNSARPVRAGGREFQHLLGLGHLPRLHHLRDAGARGETDRGFREVPAAAEAGLVQPRRRDEAAGGCA